MTSASNSTQITDLQQRPGTERQRLPFPPGPQGQIDTDGVTGADYDPLEFLLSMTRQYGDLVHYKSRYGSTYLVNHPEHIAYVFHNNNYQRGSLLKMAFGDGLLTSEGKTWRCQRRLMQPNFHPQRLTEFGPLITDVTQSMLGRWKPLVDKGQSLDVAAEMECLTLDFIIQALFSGSMSDKAKEIREAMTTMVADVGAIMCTTFNAPLTFSPSRNQQFQAVLRNVDRIIYDVIRERRAQQENGTQQDDAGDLLSVLLAPRSETGELLDDRLVRDEVITMLFAGSETTGLLLSWTWYLLSRHPEAERRLHTELDEVLDGRLPTVDDLPHLKYTHMVLQETMRLYPPVWFLFRQSLKEDEIDGYHIAANAKVVVSPYTTHRHPGFWKNPEQFEPERFTPENSEGRPRYAYLPFGAGRHLCLGNNLAMMEGQLVLATIAQCYRLNPVPGHPVQTQPLITMRMRHGLLATASTRQ
jgi:cytochrome P450